MAEYQHSHASSRPRNDRGVRRGFKRRGGSHMGGEKRSRYYERDVETEESLEAKLEELIIKFGKVQEEYNSTPESLVEKSRDLAKILNGRLVGKIQQRMHDFIKKRLIYCALILPERTASFAALIGVLNHQNYDFVEDFVHTLKEELEKSLSRCRFNTAAQIMRFLSELLNCNVLSTSSLLTIYNVFITVTYEKDIPQNRADWYIWAVLSALPWAAAQIDQDKPKGLEEILTIIESYISTKRKILFLPALQVLDRTYPTQVANDQLGQLWVQVQTMRQLGWKEHYLPKIYVGLRRVLSDAFQHKIESLDLPEHSADMHYPLPRACFHLFDSTDIFKGPHLSDPDSIERFLVEQTISGILQTYYKDRKECAVSLVGLAQRESSLAVYHLIGEILFSHMMTLPHPPYPLPFYASVMLEINSLKPGKFPAILAQASQMLFERLEMMNCICRARFLRWFVIILNNYQFQWRWEDWLPALEKEPDHPQRCFLKDVLDRSISLSYYEKIRKILPQEFNSTMPPPPSSNFVYDLLSDSDTASVNAKLIFSKIEAVNRGWKNALNKEALSEQLRNDVMAVSSDQESLARMITQCILQIGRHTLHFTRISMDRFFGIFSQLFAHEQEKVTCILAVIDFWYRVPQKLVFCVSHLLQLGIIDCNSILSWVFRPDTRSQLVSHSYIWDIINSMLCFFKRELVRLGRETQELREMKERLELVESEEGSLMGEPPTNEKIRQHCKLHQECEHALEDFFFVFFTRCISSLNEYIIKCKADKQEFKTYWFSTISQQLQFLITDNANYLKQFDERIESLLDIKDIDPTVSQIFHQALALINVIPTPGGSIIISSIKAGSISDRSGALYIGDQIISINAQNVQGLSVLDSSKLLQVQSVRVSLELLPGNNPYPRNPFFNKDYQPKMSNSDSISQLNSSTADYGFRPGALSSQSSNLYNTYII
ncbi:Nuclear cap-binding protein subunit 1-like [Oopsacas minuta]|uniref:Nuclear cap-binding protein subunit 1-like n=1 Tax=Oopsacas minuta TaxID=111878 RepID=A0AAV7KIF7_9METZ|nr:Nuclear cap-binding protein subunit 1-like [Oopsacas minuta]